MKTFLNRQKSTLRAALFGLALMPLWALGQRTEIYTPGVRTVEVRVNDNVLGTLPVMRLGTGDVLHVSFDELSHDYHRYTYKIVHLNAEFKAEESLFESDYVQATADEGVIENYSQSMNTSVLYTHYSLDLPNDYMRPLLSGNYELTVFDENEDGEQQPVLRTYFYVSEDIAAVLPSATTNTDIDWNGTHQQINVALTWQKDLILRDPDSEVRLIVLQNNRWDQAVVAPAPTGHTVNGLKWEHCKALIIPAGNEYRKFEVQSTQYPGLHTDGIRYHEPYYHVALRPDAPRKNYLYDEDQNGRFVPLAAYNADPDTGADYVWIHFRLDMPELLGGETVYLNGEWTYDRFLPQYALTYNRETEAYETAQLLKQGYYSYQYVVVSPEGQKSQAEVEGDYWQTENEYTLLVYYRQTGARYDRLLGWRTSSYRPQ